MGYFAEQAAKERKEYLISMGVCVFCQSGNVTESDNVMVCLDCGEAVIMDQERE